MADVVTFIDMLADVATLHAQTGGSKRRRAQWRKLADAANDLYRELSVRRDCHRLRGASLGLALAEDCRYRRTHPDGHRIMFGQEL